MKKRALPRDRDESHDLMRAVFESLPPAGTSKRDAAKSPTATKNRAKNEAKKERAKKTRATKDYAKRKPRTG